VKAREQRADPHAGEREGAAATVERQIEEQPVRVRQRHEHVGVRVEHDQHVGDGGRAAEPAHGRHRGPQHAAVTRQHGAHDGRRERGRVGPDGDAVVELPHAEAHPDRALDLQRLVQQPGDRGLRRGPLPGRDVDGRRRRCRRLVGHDVERGKRTRRSALTRPRVQARDLGLALARRARHLDRDRGHALVDRQADALDERGQQRLEARLDRRDAADQRLEAERRAAPGQQHARGGLPVDAADLRVDEGAGVERQLAVDAVDLGPQGAAAPHQGEDLRELGDRDRTARRPGQPLADRRGQGRGLERLADEPQRRARQGQRWLPVGRDEHGDRHAAVGEVAQEVDAVDDREHERGDEQLDPAALQHVQRPRSVADAGEPQILAAQRLLDEAVRRRFIVDE